MSEMKAQPANVDAETRRSLLCHPPPGSFDADCANLHWVLRVYDKKNNLCYDSVFIPHDRADDFLDGEGKRGDCLFYKKKVQTRKADDSDQKNEGSSQVHPSKYRLTFRLLLISLTFLSHGHSARPPRSVIFDGVRCVCRPIG